MFNGKIHYKWPFSIAMLNYQRVSFFNCECGTPNNMINLIINLPFGDGKHSTHRKGDVGDGLVMSMIGFTTLHDFDLLSYAFVLDVSGKVNHVHSKSVTFGICRKEQGVLNNSYPRQLFQVQAVSCKLPMVRWIYNFLRRNPLLTIATYPSHWYSELLNYFLPWTSD